MVQVSDLSVNTSLSPEWQNILLLGIDQRVRGESCRSDTMIICSINTETAEVKLTSLMRDMAVDFTDLGTNNGTYRLNAANYFGGPELAMKTINQLLGMNIEKYVMVNFTGFTQICEALGGIEMDITEAEMNEINKNAYNQFQIAKENGWDESNLTGTNEYLYEYGENVHLNGRQALAYARIRKIDSDWERTNRQRKVLVAMMDKMRGTNAMQLLQLGMTLQQYLETNMTLEEIINIADKVLNSGPGERGDDGAPRDRHLRAGDAQQSVHVLRHRLDDQHARIAKLHLLLRERPAVSAAGFFVSAHPSPLAARMFAIFPNF